MRHAGHWNAPASLSSTQAAPIPKAITIEAENISRPRIQDFSNIALEITNSGVAAMTEIVAANADNKIFFLLS